MKTIVPISSAPGHKAHWNPTANAVLENLKYGAIRHRLVFENGKPVYDAVQLIEPGGAAILPITPNRTAVLLRMYRHAVLKHAPKGKYPDYLMEDFGVETWEAARGYRDAGENWDTVASREFKEEAGLVANSTEHVGTVILNSAVLPVPIDLCLASITAGTAKPQRSEGVLEVQAFSRPEIEMMIIGQQIRCAMTLAMIVHAIVRGRL
jgi:8-oxo-dGTP pyrophosphatase MutT (NUDIX family)